MSSKSLPEISSSNLVNIYQQQHLTHTSTTTPFMYSKFKCSMLATLLPLIHLNKRPDTSEMSWVGIFLNV